MTSSDPNRPRTRRVWFFGGLLKVELVDGRVITARYDGFPRLRDATKAQRDNWQLIGRGVGIHWPDVDEDLSTDGLLRDAVSVAASPKAKRATARAVSAMRRRKAG